MQKQPSKGFLKKGVMKNFVEFTRKHVPESLFFDKVKLCRSAASLKTRPQRRVFLVNFAKFVRTRLSHNTTRRLLFIIAISIVFVMKEESASETVNYDTKTMYQSEPKCNLLRSTLQVKQHFSEAVFRRFLKVL